MIADNYLQLRSELETALAELLRLKVELQRDSQTLDIIHGLMTDVREPLLFVVVGEVKAGKSSLLNALFGQEFAKVDVLPATDRVYIFKYGNEERSVEVTPRLTERYQRINFLQDFNVVDTPGTNTMVAEHQTITENFIPRADLVLFVFSVTNPWTQSAWELLHFVQKKWLKNVIFVLQQADLREPNEIEVIRRHLQDTALQKLGLTPPTFAVSARKALLARTTGLDKERLSQESGFPALEEQIDFIVSSSGIRILKLRTATRSARIILDEVAEEVMDPSRRSSATKSNSRDFIPPGGAERANIAAGQRISPRCRAGMPRFGRTGNAGIGKKTFFLAHMETDFFKRPVAAGFPARSGEQVARIGAAKSGKRCAVAGNRLARTLAAIAGHDRSAIRHECEKSHRKDGSGFRTPTPRTTAIDPARAARKGIKQGIG